jgi:hypothetical protein
LPKWWFFWWQDVSRKIHKILLQSEFLEVLFWNLMHKLEYNQCPWYKERLAGSQLFWARVLVGCLSLGPSLYLLFLILFIVVLEYIVAFTKVLTIYQIYNTWIHPVIFLLYSPIPRIVSSGLILPFTYMCTQ